MSEDELKAKIFRLQARVDQLEAVKTPMPSAERRRIRRELWKQYKATTADQAGLELAVEILGHLASLWEVCPMHSALAARSRPDDEEEEAGVGSMFR